MTDDEYRLINENGRLKDQVKRLTRERNAAILAINDAHYHSPDDEPPAKRLARFYEQAETLSLAAAAVVITTRQRAGLVREPEKAKSFRARIALAIDSTGRYNAAGWGTLTAPGDPADVAANATDNLYDPEGMVSLVWITADVPVPETVEIRGELDLG